MRFDEAVKLLLEGKNITSKTIREHDDLDKAMPYFYLDFDEKVLRSEDECRTVFVDDDIFADDWEEYNPESDSKNE